LERQHGEWMDTGAQGTSIRTDRELEAMGAGYGAANRRREGNVVTECLVGRASHHAARAGAVRKLRDQEGAGFGGRLWTFWLIRVG
jgi:hypothetical protein